MTQQDSQHETLGWLIKIHWVLMLSLLALVLIVERESLLAPGINSLDILLAASGIYLSLYFFYTIRRVERVLAPALFLADGFFSALAVLISGGFVSYYLPLFLIGILGACLVCSRRAATLIVAWHFALFLGSVSFVYYDPIPGLLPKPDEDDIATWMAVSPSAVGSDVFYEQILRWCFFMGITTLLCAILVRQIWIREARVRARERFLEQKRRLIQMGELTGRIAHGINTPLGLLSGNLEMLLAETRKGTKVHKRLVELDGYLQRAITTLRKILDTSRQTLSPIQKVALTDVLTTVVEAAQPKLKRKRARLILDLEPGLPEIQGHPEGLHQAFLNVLENAVDSIPEEGLVTLSAQFRYRSVRLSVADRRGEVRVTVRDNGPGIPEEDLERIFEPFYSTKEFGHGTGLGLAIVKRVMEEHQGTIWMESKPGMGTTVFMTFPTEARSQEMGASKDVSKPSEVL